MIVGSDCMDVDMGMGIGVGEGGRTCVTATIHLNGRSKDLGHNSAERQPDNQFEYVIPIPPRGSKRVTMSTQPSSCEEDERKEGGSHFACSYGFSELEAIHPIKNIIVRNIMVINFMFVLGS